jgi:hypothetical protein
MDAVAGKGFEPVAGIWLPAWANAVAWRQATT